MLDTRLPSSLLLAHCRRCFWTPIFDYSTEPPTYYLDTPYSSLPHTRNRKFTLFYTIWTIFTSGHSRHQRLYFFSQWKSWRTSTHDARGWKIRGSYERSFESIDMQESQGRVWLDQFLGSSFQLGISWALTVDTTCIINTLKTTWCLKAEQRETNCFLTYPAYLGGPELFGAALILVNLPKELN